MNLIFLNYFNISLFLGGVIALLSGAGVYFNNRQKRENKAWLALNICSAIWSFGYLTMITATSKEIAWQANWVLHAGAILIPLLYFQFIISFTHQYEKFKYSLYTVSTLTVFFSIANYSKYFVNDVIPKFTFNYVCNAGPLYTAFAVYFFLLVLYSGWVLLAYIKTAKPEENLRNKFIFFSSLFGFIGGGSVFFITFNIPIPPYPLILYSLYPATIAVAMMRYNLFNIKLITSQILVAVIWILLLIRTFMSANTQDFIMNSSLLLLIVILGILLVSTVKKQLKYLLTIEDQAKELKKANVRLNEFMSFASHEIRGPLTAVKGIASNILDGDYGEISQSMRDAARQILVRGTDVVALIGLYLNKSKLELGVIKYDFVNINLNDLITTVLISLKASADNAGVSITFIPPGQESTWGAMVDRATLQEVLYNVIDNSIKYAPVGHIKISLEVVDKKIQIKISDDGIGIAPDVMPLLFKKWSRAENTERAQIKGNGLGLYLAKQIIDAHKGKIWAESPGEGKGSTFIIELSEAAVIQKTL